MSARKWQRTSQQAATISSPRRQRTDEAPPRGKLSCGGAMRLKAVVPLFSLTSGEQDELAFAFEIESAGKCSKTSTRRKRRKPARPQEVSLTAAPSSETQVLAGSLSPNKLGPDKSRGLALSSRPRASHKATKTTSKKLSLVLISSIVVVLGSIVALAIGHVFAKPNNNNQQLQLTDKQLLRKAFDSSESSRANAIGSSAINNQPSGVGGANFDSLSSQSQSATTTSSSTTQLNNRQQAADTRQQQQQQQQLNSADGPSGTSGFQCPEQFGYYTDAKDCTKYYVCVFGEVLHESCTGGLRFSRELQTCDWPRNVDCPQGQAGGQQTNQTTTSESATTQASTQSTLPSSFSSSSTQPSSPITSSVSTTTPPSTTTSSSSSSSSSTASGNNNKPQPNSLVFADENSDPQQPSFDEAISPVITADGAIHLHDGSGGTFGLGPNDNRALVSSSPQSINGPVEAGSLSGPPANGRQLAGNQNVDVFVMPLSIAGRQQPSLPVSKQQRTRFQQEPRQQLTTLSPANDKLLQPATSLPTNINQHQQFSRQQQPQPSESNVRDAGELSDESGDFNLNNNNPTTSSGEIESENSNEGEDESDSNGDHNGGGGDVSQALPVGSPLRSHADQESSEPQDQAAPRNTNNNESEQDQFSNNSNGDYVDEANNGAGQTGATYIPPVLSAPNDNNFQGPRQAPSQNNASPNRQSNHQSSPLLSINNRQIVDPTRQTFKPILAPEHHQLLASSNTRPTNQNLNSLNQNQNTRAREQQQNQQSNINANNRQNNQQQLQQLQSSNAQNNRQSRMSSSFQKQNSNANQNLATSQAPQNPFFSPLNQSSAGSSRFLMPLDRQQQQLFSNNSVNFNDSSKLIRLQTSQQAQLFSQEPNQNTRNSNSLAPTFQPRFPQHQQAPRSQQNTLLFSAQKPTFGFVSSPADETGPSQRNFPGGQNQNQNSFQQDPRALNNNNNPALTHNQNFHQTFTTSQQQRRSRPPKRHQIPSGSGNGQSSSSLAPSAGSQRPNALLDFDTTTTTSTMSTPLMNARLPPSMLEQDNDNDQNGDQTAGAFSGTGSGANPQAQLRARPNLPPRPVVAAPPTTVNFRDSPTPATFGATTGQPLGSTNAASVAPSRQRFTSAAGVQTSSTRNSQPPALQQATPFDQQPTQQQQFGSSTSTTTTSSNSLISSTSQQLTTPPSSSSSAPLQEPDHAGGSTQDPQTVANRYLNSAIDALEAGQPFGTVDYDFDILNDNSTERRPPQQVGSAPAPTSGPSSPTTRQSASVSAQRNNKPTQLPENQVTSNVQQSGQHEQQRPPRQRGPPAAQQPSATSAATAPAAAPTKKPRPTNKKIVVDHEKALANLRASVEPAKRPEAIFSTPQANQPAQKCDNRVCRLPDCKCGDTLTPGGMDPKVIPQVVLLTFDDAVNDLNWEIYEELFSGRTNPNGCPVLATFYVSHEWTDYGQVQTLYSRGHEMASHSVTHSFGEKFSKSQWFKEINGQREILNMYGGVKMNDVRGMRAPFLQIGGNKMFEMLYDANFTYDSSMPIFENSPPLWPYTLDYQVSHECMITPCPTKSYPGVWEVGMTMWVDLRGGRCSMGDACSNPTDEDGVYEMLMKNFNRHYKSNRAPFGLFYHSAWFNTVHHRRGFLRFMATVNALPEVFFVTNWQMLQWMRQPTPLSEINSFEPWQCPAKNDRPPPCFHPSVCNVKSEHGSRFMKTCQPCPANQQYPWPSVLDTELHQGDQVARPVADENFRSCRRVTSAATCTGYKSPALAQISSLTPSRNLSRV